MYVCMYVCMFVCMYVCMYVCLAMQIWLCKYGYANMAMLVWLYMYSDVCMSMYLSICMHDCVCITMYVCMKNTSVISRTVSLPINWASNLYPRGRFGIVSKVREKATGKFFAAKYIKVRAATRCIVRQEIELLCAVRHKRIVKLYDVFEESRKFILVLEW